jgi:integrase
MRRSRHQTGSIIERSGVFLIRYYTTKLSGGRPKRTQVSEKLVEKSDRYHSRNCKAVRQLRDEFMRKINDGPLASPEVLVTEFWENTYLPYLRETKRPSTRKGYEKLWRLELEDHFRGRSLRDYRTHQGSEFLTSLAKRGLGRASIAHVRSLASGIFSHAVNRGLIERNSWREVKLLAKPKDSTPTAHYTLEEAENVISALKDRVDAQLLFALAFFLGLRPSEVAGLCWEDFDEEWVHIRRGVVGREVGPTKTPESVASIPLIQPVRGLLSVWRQESGNPSEGWVFLNRRGGPVHLDSFARTAIIPRLEAKKLAWKGLYAARRGAGTVLTRLTGDALAAREILRHKNLAVTTGYYVKQMPAAGLAGMKLLEAEVMRRSEG